MTVHAPHVPSSHTFFAPRRPRSSRSASRRVRWGGTCTPAGRPFTSRATSTAAGPTCEERGTSEGYDHAVAIERVGVAGFGAMGSGIAQVCAQAGCTVTVREVDQAAIDRGWRSVDGSLARIVKGGRMSEDDAK